ncbi:MAG: hypothetical protein R6V54_02810 [Desulfobacteraceae bacterium]
MEAVTIFDFWYDLARGPLVWISFGIFLMGSVYRSMQILALTRIRGSGQEVPDRTIKDVPWVSVQADEKKGVYQRFVMPLKFTVFGRHPVFITVTFIFHLLLFAAPLFLLAHNILLDNALGISFFSFSEQTSNTMTVVLLACILFFLLRRFFLPGVRAITYLEDYMMLLMVTLPFLTGFLAFHQIFDYQWMITLHMGTGLVMIAAAPFTKIFHMIFFFFGRFLIVSEHSMGRGSRTW